MGLDKAKARIAVVDPSSFVLPFDYHLLRELRKHTDIEIDFYCSQTTANYAFVDSIAALAGVTVFRYSISSSVTSRLIGVVNYLRMLSRLVRTRKSYAAIMFQFSILPFIEIPFFLLFQNRLCFFLHNYAAVAGSERPSWALRFIWNIASKLVFVSRFALEQFRERYDNMQEKWILAQHGVMRIDPLRSSAGFPVLGQPVERAIVFWGLVKRYKGVGMLLRASQEQVPKGYKFEVHGKWQSNERHLKNELIKSGVTIEDRFLTVEEVERLIKRNVIFVLPYTVATQSGVLYTFLEYGCVFVATDVGDVGFFLRKHGLHRLLFDRNSLTSFASAVRFATDEYDILRRTLLELRRHYSWESSAKALLSQAVHCG